MPCVVSGALVSLGLTRSVDAQARAASPVAPAATIGPVTDAATLSLLGMASSNDGGTAIGQRNELWAGATQPLAQFHRLKLTAIGSGNWRFRDVVGSDASTQGILSLRARARIGQQRVWSAVSYGRSQFNGSQASGLVGASAITLADPALMAAGLADTTVSRRIDAGRISRAEGGLVTSVRGVELSFGMSVERASRTTTQTITVGEADAIPVMSSLGTVRRVTTRVERTLQRRDVATGIASMGFNTGPASWLVSVTAPVATWLTEDALAPKAAAVPTIASVAVVQPITGWLSLVGAAATSQATMGGAQFRDQVSLGRRHDFSPVLAFGVRISRDHDRDGDGTPGGILAFETRTLGAVDSISVEQGPVAQRLEGDTLRVVLLIDAPRAEMVELMGDATEWSVKPMRRNTSGRWRAELKLAPGMHRIIVRADGGKWIAPPGLPVGNDDYGTPVGMIVIRGKQP